MSYSEVLKMFQNYDPSNYYLLNMKRVKFSYSYGSPEVFEIEKFLSEDEKLNILNIFTENGAVETYNILLSLEENSEKIKKNPDNHSYNMNSLRSFFKSKDKKDYFKESLSRRSRMYCRIPLKHPAINKVGAYVGHEFNVNPYSSITGGGNGYTILGNSEYGNRLSFTDYDVIHNWFNQLMKELYNLENSSFRSVDPLEQKITKIKEYGKSYGVFDNERLNDIVWNKRPKGVTQEELDAYLECYIAVEKTLNKCVNALKKDPRVQK